MIEAQLNYFDMAVIGVLFLSCTFAFFRGFVKEILSLIGWVGSAVVAVAFFKPFALQLQPHFTSPLVATAFAVGVLYFGSLLGFAIISRFIIKILKSGSEIGIFDNILGFAFGALRGAFIISIAFFMISLVITSQNRPEWLEKAKTRPYVEKMTAVMVSIAPERFKALGDLQDKAKNGIQSGMKEDFERSMHEQAVGAGPQVVRGREVSEKEAMDSFNKLLKDLGKK